MKQFFEQYGAVALGILALLVLIAMITPVGNIIKTSLQGTTETFSSRMNTQTDTMTKQMSDIMNSAGEFLNIKEDGKMYKGDELYTGWDEDKAYLNGAEQTVYTTGMSGPHFFYEGNYWATKEEYANNGVNTNHLEFVYLKIDNKLIFENIFVGRYDDIPVAEGVSTYELVVSCPTEYNLEWSLTNNGYVNYPTEIKIIESNSEYKMYSFKGIINVAYPTGSYRDLDCDDILITQA